jgi:hypothetical protein
VEDYPLTPIRAGLRAGLGNGLTFVVGVGGGTLLALFVVTPDFGLWYAFPLAALGLLFLSMFKLWGFLLIPVYAIVFYGLSRAEWSRIRSGCLLAAATAGVILLSLEADLDGDGAGTRLILGGGLLMLLAVGSVLWGQRHLLHRAATDGEGPPTLS